MGIIKLMGKPLVSVIIPCYNSGVYLMEAIQSVEICPDKSFYEIIIINDGSTDKHTLDLLQHLEGKSYIVLHKENNGPASARNLGCKFSKSKYLLLLDSDNKIRPDYLVKGADILNQYEDVGVVYGKPAFFGHSSDSRFSPQAFDKFAIVLGNYIDNCTMIRKQVWEDLNGFDESRIVIGHEDWEFWIRVSSTRWKFYFLQEILFDYRIKEESLITKASVPEKVKQMKAYVYAKNMDIIVQNYKELHFQFLCYQNDRRKPLRSFFKYLCNRIRSTLS